MDRLHSSLRRISAFDLALCLRFNRTSRYRAVRHFFWFWSRIGNGMFWYALAAVLPLVYGQAAWPAVAAMSAAGVIGLQLYRWLKVRTLRPRPFQVYSAIQAGAPVLDRFSFPSGHTLHAVSFTTVCTAFFPETAPLLWSVAALVAMSRPVLGLHYPTDVVAGGLLGFGVAHLVLLAA